MLQSLHPAMLLPSTEKQHTHLCLRKTVPKLAGRQQAQQAIRCGGQHLWLAIAVQVRLRRGRWEGRSKEAGVPGQA